ncbi:MAG: hypothetical protein H8E66_25680 [Planctomycetes bacterium]|nr:hypothetical protein [Planctomycetota bacterium]
MNQGKLVIVFIFGLSAVMGAYAWWHHFTQGRRCVELWGAQTGELIRYAPQVELLQLDDVDATDGETIRIDDKPHAIIAQRDITGTQGLVHARQALIEDASYLWNANLVEPSNWRYLLRFTDGDEQVSVVIDCDHGRVHLVGTDRQAALNAHLTKGYRERLPVWLGLDVNSSAEILAASANTP